MRKLKIIIEHNYCLIQLEWHMLKKLAGLLQMFEGNVQNDEGRGFLHYMPTREARIYIAKEVVD